MTFIAEATAATSAANQLVNLIKLINPADKKTTVQQLNEAIGLATKLNLSVLDLTNKTVELNTEVVHLRVKLAERETVKIEPVAIIDGIVWKMKADGIKDGPYCPKCYHKDTKMIPLGPMIGAGGNLQIGWECSVCGSNFYTARTPVVMPALGPKFRRAFP